MTVSRCGFIAVVGRPNVGKSTLINAVVGEKVSIVTHKPQTTRHRILAVHTVGDAQMIFVDTPGLHRHAGRAMNRLMNRTASAALADADLILFISDATRWTAEDEDVIERLRSVRAPVIAVINKIDLISPRNRLLELIAAMAKRMDFAEIVPLSAAKNRQVDELVEAIPRYLPESVALFPEGTRTDRGPEFHASEVIREKLTRALHQELPYGLTVQVQQYAQDEERLTIHAVIWVERDSQKGMTIGKGGDVLKKVGRAARLELSRSLGCPVHIELWVKVKENWSDSDRALQSLGYEQP